MNVYDGQTQPRYSRRSGGSSDALGSTACPGSLTPTVMAADFCQHWSPGNRIQYIPRNMHTVLLCFNCFVVVMESFILNSHWVFIHIHQGCFAGTGAIVRLPQCQWSKPDGYGKISQCITTTKHSKAKTVCIFLGIYCIWLTSGTRAIVYLLYQLRQTWFTNVRNHYKTQHICLNFSHMMW